MAHVLETINTQFPVSALPAASTYFHHRMPSRTDMSGTPSPGASSDLADDDTRPSRLAVRPKMGSRKSSGSMIVSRDAICTMVESDIEDDDVRSMSPRRSSAELTRLSEQARHDMIEQARTLQMSLQALVDRVEAVKSEHEKLEGGNKFLQSYIGELMQTSKITSSAPTRKSKSRGIK